MEVSHTESSEKGFQTSTPELTAEEWLEQSRSNRVRFETCWHKHDDETPAFFRAFQGHCSRPLVNPKFFGKMIEIPHRWTNVIYHSSSQQHLDKILLTGLIAGRTRRKEGRQACYFSAAHPQESTAVRHRKSWQPQLVPYVHPQVVYRNPSVKLIWPKHHRWG